jgi:purine catabolism regulator
MTGLDAPSPAPGAFAVTVRSAFDLPAFRRGMPEVVAGASELDRPIRWVHAGEVPNMASLLKGGELLLTTGMGIKTSRADQIRFVRELAAKRVAALAIEYGTTFRIVPAALAAESERVGMPLIVLHEEVPFVEITEEIHRQIVNHQYELVRRGDALHERFTELMLRGAGIPDVLDALAHAIGNPVLLEKAEHTVLFHACNVTNTRGVLAAWDATAKDASGAAQFIDVPVPTPGPGAWGRLIALELDSPFDEFDRVAIERAVGLVALALLRLRQEEMLGARERGNLISTLLAGELDELEARQRMRSAGFSQPSPLLLPIVIGYSHEGAAAIEEAGWALVARDVRRSLESTGLAAVAGAQPHRGRIFLVVGVSAGQDRVAVANRIWTETASAIKRQLDDRTQWTMSVGPLATTWMSVRTGFTDVLDTVPAALAIAERQWHDATRPDLDRLLWQLSAAPELSRFADSRLAALLAHDARRKTKLVPTLETYLVCGGRKAETARRLHLERQSLYHRLERIASILDVDLDDGETRLALHLALRAANAARAEGAYS